MKKNSRVGFVVEIFERAGAAIVDVLRKLHGGGAERFAQIRREAGGGRFLPHLLSAPLQRAFALVEMDRVLAVAQDLHFDMPRPRYEALKIKTAVAERRVRFRDRLRNLLFELGRRLGHADASAAAARRSLDHDRIAYARRGAERGLDALDPPLGTRHGSDAGAALRSRALALSPIARIVSGVGPTKISPAASTFSAKSAFSERKP